MKPQRFSLMSPILLVRSLQVLWRPAKAAMLIAVLALSTLPSVAFAGVAEATVSKNVIALGDALQLTVSVDESVSNDALDLSPLDKDFIYGRPSVSSNTSYINGNFSRTTVWRVAIAGKRVGNVTIPSLTIDDMTTEPITVQVVDAGDKGAQGDTQAVEVIATLDRHDGYIGETFNYRVRLMIGTRLDSPALQAPFGEGMDVAQVGDDVQAEAVVNGRRYVVISRQYQITPTQAGELTLEGAVFSGTEVKGNSWGSSVGLPISRQANSLTLNISPKPADYKGLWLPTPDLDLTQRWEPNTLSESTNAQVGEPINRVISLKIKNIAQSAMPNLNLDYPTSVSVYSDKPEYSEDGDYTVMTVKQVIIPRQAGDVTLPPLSINWFNTSRKQPETSKIEGLTLSIEAGENTPITQPIMPDVALTPSAPAPSNSENVVITAGYWPWATGFFAVLWLGTLGMYLRRPEVIVPQNNATARQSIKGTGNALLALKTAVNANDAVAVSTHYRNWKNGHLPFELREGIDAEISAMMASRYRPQAESWDNSELLSLLSQAETVSKDSAKKATKKGDSLSELTP
ncbi:BatD family protein [Enterovibrio makurazakiensis]|uniref:BatD family protein n=1 Tax=Enterovibrio makurazakiensis TaxID=2910232 RepID=UPI003D224014